MNRFTHMDPQCRVLLGLVILSAAAGAAWCIRLLWGVLR